MIREVLDLRRLRALHPDEAAAILAARRLEAPSADDERALDAWLQLDAAHAAAWARAQRALGAFDSAGDDELLTAMRRAAIVARPMPRPWLRGAVAAAAMLVVAAGVGLAMFAVRGGDVAAPPASGALVAQADAPRAPDYQTRKGQQATFVLPDGSRMTLDTDSAVEIAFAADRRALRLLRGRAFFDVKHDPQRPFAVQADGREVVALGTRFDVRLDPGRLRVVLVEGRVSVAPMAGRGTPAMLRAGEQLVEREGTPPAISAADLEESQNWQRGFVTFHDDTLAQAAAEMNRYSPDRLVVRDPGLAGLRVSGVFRAGDANRFGRNLAQIHPIRLVRNSPKELELVRADR